MNKQKPVELIELSKQVEIIEETKRRSQLTEINEINRVKKLFIKKFLYKRSRIKNKNRIFKRAFYNLYKR